MLTPSQSNRGLGHVILNRALTAKPYLPAGNGRCVPRRSGVIMVRINFNRLRFLVIDDNAHMRRIMRSLILRTLRQFNGLIIRALNGVPKVSRFRH